MAGVVPNIRLPGPDAEPLAPGVTIEFADNDDAPIIDEKGNLLQIEHGDGSITISLDGSPLQDAKDAGPSGWFDNLAEDIDRDELSRISEELLRGITADLDSRKDWIEDRANGIKLLGLKLEVPGIQGSADGAPVEGMSKIRHPLLLEAVLRFQANARSELLPTDGPVKIRNDDTNGDTAEDKEANDLETDFNHYLTATATEYYPDTDRMLLMLGFGGTAFKKVYFCPLRGRPVSESIDADDLIVSNTATDLSNARRITHRSMMRPSVVTRMQILGVYRDIELNTPNAQKMDAAQQAKKDQQGVDANVAHAEDRDREIYECYCELDIQGFGHKWKGKPTGLELPYRVTIDVTTREILSVVRNYDEDTKELPTARQNFVKYTFVPGMGFYDIGLLHILGNTTNALTAAWRLMLDAGMFANFPGFLMADTGARQNTNMFRVPPGGGALVKTGGMKIGDAVMPLPYKESGPAFAALAADMSQTGQRVGGTSEQQVGEGRADAPVGTTLAMIEQAKMILNSVHKRMHAAQTEEFRLLSREFREHPESFWQANKKPARDWNPQAFLAALDDADLVPQADPNTASFPQRIAKLGALKQLQAANPGQYDPIAIDTVIIQALGFSNPEQFFVPADAQGQMPPEMQAKLMDNQVDQIKAQASMLASEAKMKEVETNAQLGQAQTQIKGKEVQVKALTAQTDAENRAADRRSEEKIQLLDLAQNVAVHPESLPIVEQVLDANNTPPQPGLVPPQP
jgi:hypothetical protein